MSVTSTGWRSSPTRRRHRRHLRRDGDRHPTAHLAGQLHRRRTADPTARFVAVGVAVEEQVQPPLGADLDQAQGAAGVLGHTGQRREEGRAPADLVGLGRPGGEQALELVAVIEAERPKHRVRVVGAGPHDARLGGHVGVPAPQARVAAVEHEEVDGVQQQVAVAAGRPAPRPSDRAARHHWRGRRTAGRRAAASAPRRRRSGGTPPRTTPCPGGDRCDLTSLLAHPGARRTTMGFHRDEIEAAFERYRTRPRTPGAPVTGDRGSSASLLTCGTSSISTASSKVDKRCWSGSRRR